MIAPDNRVPACAQVYVLDGAAQVEARMGLKWGHDLKRDLVAALGEMLRTENPFVEVFMRAADPDVQDKFLCITGRAPT